MSRRGREARGIACLLAVLVSACSHRTLTLFFDGVPPPRAPLQEARQVPSGRESPAPGAKGTEHGPYAAKLCGACHASQATNSLLAPASELCGRCHTLALDKKYVHGPLASGGCLVCHDPHASRYPHLLVSESGEFCVRCHDRRDLDGVGAHAAVEAQCTDCHEAHMSDKLYLLR